MRTLEHKHLHELALMSGGAALLVSIVALLPTLVFAWTIYISNFTYTPVATGGNTTISWYAGSAQYCTLTGPTLPCVTFSKGGTSCSVTTYGTSPGSVNIGNVNTGPINGPTTYNLSCYSPAGCSWWCNDGNGASSLTVYPSVPTPSTLSSFTATPATILVSGKAVLSWSGTKGNNFKGCDLTGGQWGSGTWFSALPGTVTTNTLTQTTTYNINCFDNSGTATGWKSAKVTVVPPLGPCNDIPAQTTVPSGCVTPVPTPGVCTPTGGSYSAPTNTCSCPSGKHLSGSSCVNNPLCSNGLADSYAPSCACPSGQYQPLGTASCVALPICANGLGPAYSPTCVCPSGQVQVKGGSTCVLQGAINTLTVNPSRVLKGNRAVVSWSTANMATCALSALDSSARSALSSALSSSITLTINAKTIYTLTCADKAGLTYASSITVNLIPQTIEQ